MGGARAGRSSGAETVDHGGVRARWYFTPGHGDPATDAGWWLLDLPGGFRVVELDVGTRVWDPFHREARKVLATLTAV
jgi:hypothetical protein